MKGKKEYIILAAIIIAAAAYLMLRQTDRFHYHLPQMATVEKKDISKIELTGSGETVTLTRKDGQWRISPQDYPVDTEKIERILGTLSGLKLTAMVSESKNDLLYDLGPEKRIQVKAWSGEILKRDFMVGKAANTFRHTFVKIAGDDRVFHAENNFRDQFDVTVDVLRDKSVLAFKPEEIRTITITKGDKTTEFNKKEITGKVKESKLKNDKKAAASLPKTIQWITADNRMADSNKIRSFLATLSNLKCKTYLNDRKKEDLRDPVVSITLSGAKTYRLTVYTQEKKGEGDMLWPAQSSENTYPFLLADWKARDIVKDPSDLLPGKPTSQKEKNN